MRFLQGVRCQGANTMRPHATKAANVPTGASFLRPYLRSLAPYKPIEPFDVLSARLGRPAHDIVKLDANENPYGPPPEVREALANMEYPNIYPDPESRALRAGLAKWHNVPEEYLMAGSGADELLDFLMRCTLEPGDCIIDCPPTFGMYSYDAEVNAGRVIQVPRLDGFQIDVEGIKKAVKEHRPKLLFLTSPNNPDGSLISDEDLLDLLELPVLVVFDEAYIEFSDVPSKMSWVMERENLIVLRTFSKCAALAGMRIGYGAFPKSMLEILWRAKQPYNVTTASQVAAVAAMQNLEYIQSVRDKLVAERQRLFKALQQISFIEPYPSHSNFILCRITDGRNAAELRSQLATQFGVMIRHYSTPELNRCVRISVGTPENSERLLEALQAVA